MKIEALHEFGDPEFAKIWAAKFHPTMPRIQLFKTITDQIVNLKSYSTHVLELGIGPGFLASYILNRMPYITYEGLDYSRPMLDLAKARVKAAERRIDFVQADLIKEVWTERIKKCPNVIVSTWTLHDLFEKNNIFSIYKAAYAILPLGGILLNGDFVKPEKSIYDYEGGRIKPSEHLELLWEAGFQTPLCIAEFEKSVENPTTSNNYSCFMAKK